MAKTYTLYTDGAISNNGNKNGSGIMEGGIGWLLVGADGEIIVKGCKFYPNDLQNPVTNNRMELLAYIEGLTYIHENLHFETEEERKNSKLRVYSDSAYFINSVNEFIKKWQRNGWKNNTGQPVKNKDLWLRILTLKDDKTLFKEQQFLHIKGHSGHEFQEQADTLAVRGKEGETFVE